MWKGGDRPHSDLSNSEGSGEQQVVAVAVDEGRSSQHALKWAADHIMLRGQIFILLHVRRKIATIPTPSGYQVPISELEEDVASVFIEQMDLQTKELLLPFQCFCSRRGLQCKEVILDDLDVSKAIVDFVMHQTVDKLVLGSSSRNLFTRTFKQADVPTSVSKMAPEFCTVYVISKGKISSIRPANRASQHPANKPACEFETASNRFLSAKSATDARYHSGAPGRTSFAHRTRDASSMDMDKKIGERNSRASQAGGHLDFSCQSVASCPSPTRRSIDESNNYFSPELLDHVGQRSHLMYMSNENTYLNEQRKGFEPNSADGANWSREYDHSPTRRSIDQPNYFLRESINRGGQRPHLLNINNVFEPNSNGANWSSVSGSREYVHSPTMRSIDQPTNNLPRLLLERGGQRPHLLDMSNEQIYINEQRKGFEPNNTFGANWSGDREHGRSPTMRSIDQTNRYFPREILDRGRQRSHLFNMGNGDMCLNVPRRSFEANYTDGANWSSGSGSQHSSNLSKEDAHSSSPNYSMDYLDVELKRLKLELKMGMDKYDDTPNEGNHIKADAELRMAETRLAEDNLLEIEEKKKRRPKRIFDDEPIAEEKAKIEKSTEIAVQSNLSQEVLKKTETLDGFSSNIQYRRYTLEEIQKVTDNFSDSLKIGEGGYGPVFKSTLDHTLVAIKILGSDAAQGMKQFHQEVEVLSCIQHPNMVCLLGACPEHGCLVYEYMANGSLEDRLFCRSGTSPLSWRLRFKIAAEISTGLLYLHQMKPEPIVHRDLKPGNILLDHNYVSKIADVGLARLVPPSTADSVTQYRMTAAAGTFCYIDPEYQKTGLLGIKSDIYALGIILLQLITGQPPMGLTQKVECALEMDELGEILDAKVTDWPVGETRRYAELALKCTELRRKDRPDLGSVVLPEMNRLRELALSTEAAPRDHRTRRSSSFKEGSQSMEYLDNAIAQGSSASFFG